MFVDVLVAEIGSTTTLLNAFTGLSGDNPAPLFLGQGQAPTSVLAGDVRVGLDAARADLAAKLGCDSLECGDFLATSSAAGGLRMCVHGLVYDMTVKAAMAAALGAGAVIRQTTAGKLSEYELDELHEVDPKLIMLAGGTDYGEQQTAIYNARVLADAGIKVPVVYAGNVQCVRAVKKIFAAAGIPLFVTENVYPKLDLLNIEPARQVIQQAFEENIVRAPGMEHIRERVNGEILPTPGAVMETARVLYESLGDLVVFDVGGATTDVHSVTPGSEEISLLATGPEPLAKRTVEGDLGVYVNARSLLQQVGRETVLAELGQGDSGEMGLGHCAPVGAAGEHLAGAAGEHSAGAAGGHSAGACGEFPLDTVLADYRPIPESAEQMRLTSCLCRHCALMALERHVGRLRYVYSPSGRRTVAEGKDLSLVRTLVATGGALTKLQGREAIMQELVDFNKSGMALYPAPGRAEIRYDHHYIMASLGVLSKRYRWAVPVLMQASFANRPLASNLGGGQ